MVEGLLNRVLKRKDASLTSYEGEFSRENFAEYARMCVQVGWKIAEFIQDADKPVTILLPSRGALPIFIGAMLALERDKSLSELNLAPRISLPPLNCFNYVRPSAEEKVTSIL